jgi:uncharacterized protein (DUF488 family)
METQTFIDAADHLQKIAENDTTAYMCSEAVWWRCHRALVSDYLKIRDWDVQHIMATDKAEEHPYTSAAKVENGILTYSK